MELDADTVVAACAIAALPFSIAATLVALLADKRARVAARAQTFLALRSRFIEVHQQLPAHFLDPAWSPGNDDEKAAISRYWHHAFDEWYITTHLDRRLLGSLWADFFLGATLAALRHHALRRFFADMNRSRNEHDTHWRNYAKAIEQAWRSTHRDKSTVCAGLDCMQSHDH